MHSPYVLNNGLLHQRFVGIKKKRWEIYGTANIDALVDEEAVFHSGNFLLQLNVVQNHTRKHGRTGLT
jgi:hypothetical protein